MRSKLSILIKTGLNSLNLHSHQINRLESTRSTAGVERPAMILQTGSRVASQPTVRHRSCLEPFQTHPSQTAVIWNLRNGANGLLVAMYSAAKYGFRCEHLFIRYIRAARTITKLSCRLTVNKSLPGAVVNRPVFLQSDATAICCKRLVSAFPHLISRKQRIPRLALSTTSCPLRSPRQLSRATCSTRRQNPRRTSHRPKTLPSSPTRRGSSPR